MKKKKNNINTYDKQIISKQNIKENTSDDSLKIPGNNDKNKTNEHFEHFNRFTVFNTVDNFKTNVVDFILTLLFITVPLVLLVCILMFSSTSIPSL